VGNYITFPELLIWIPFIGGLVTFFIKAERPARWVSLLFALSTLGVSIATLFFKGSEHQSWNTVNYFWLKYIGNSFYLGIDPVSRVLILLTALCMPLIILMAGQNNYKQSRYFYGLLLLSQAGIIGVFCALDALLFYFFWELALIPAYFLSSIWGGPRRIPATFKFFVYTFLGSLLMLAGILYVYMHSPGRMFEDGTTAQHSFALKSFLITSLSAGEQIWLYLLFFFAFAIKMPIFPFHTWQPEAYDQSPSPVTMLLSAVMVKMGLFGLVRWLLPLFPLAATVMEQWVIIFSVIGIIYASCIAIVQDNVKYMAAYSSIAHIGLMAAAIFTGNLMATEGAMMQLFNHGINILGVWVVLDIIERKTGAKNISAISGLAVKAPVLSIFALLIAFANIALPLTNAFAGEFLMFAGIYQFNPWLAAVAGISVILAAIYMLNMLRRVFFGEPGDAVLSVSDIKGTDLLVLAVIAVIILVTGFYPEALLGLAREAAATVIR
jgi:NADH-quinone oxidoreductase subunit M